MLFSFSLSSVKTFFQSEKDFLQFIHRFLAFSNIQETMDTLGFEVENIKDYTHKDRNIFDDFIVAQILSAQPHPNADKLQICQVTDGQQIFQIICGAPNARAGIKVVMAHIGAFIPGCNFYIESRKIRGQASGGMLCSESELGFGENSEGIIELELNAPVGMKISEYYELTLPLITLNIPFNRGDCLNLLGIFREFFCALFITSQNEAAFLSKLLSCINSQHTSDNIPDIQHFETEYQLYIDHNNLSSCSTFAFIEIRNLDNTIQTPRWLQNSLRHFGVKSVSVVVDVTNYILMTYGQPMHAYDAMYIKDGLWVKHCEHKVAFQALNGQEYTPHNLLVVCDSNEVHAVAGLIGGEKSKVTAKTSRIILEAAVFNETEVAKSSNILGLQTSSSTRFARSGVDKVNTYSLLQKSAQLITEICGGEISKPKILNTDDTQNSQKVTAQPIKLTHQKLLTYTAIYTNALVEQLKQDRFCKLSNVGIWSWHEKDLLCTPHNWRKDIRLDVDLIEEIVRHYHIFENDHSHNPSDLSHANDLHHSKPNYLINLPIDKLESQFGLKDIFYLKEVMLSGGYRQVITWSFMDQRQAEIFYPSHSLIITNPVSNDLNALRPSIVPNLLDIATQNMKNGKRELNLFEYGTTFSFDEQDKKYKQSLHLTALSNCIKNSNYFEKKSRSLLDFKADLLRFLSCVLPDLMIEIKNSAPAYYHPTRSGAIYYNHEKIGYIGQLHPSITSHCRGVDFFAFELININDIFCKFSITREQQTKHYKYQAVSRDYSFVTHQSSVIGKAIRKLTQEMRDVIRNIELLDVYHIKDDTLTVHPYSAQNEHTDDISQLQDTKLPNSNHISFTLSVTIQTDHTFTSDELEGISDKIIKLMENEFNVKLRS